MAKALRYRLFGFGQISPAQKIQLTNEGIIFQDEGLKSSITFEDYRAPGKRFLWKRRWFIGSLFLTQKQLLAYAYSNCLIQLVFQDPRIQKLNTRVEKERLYITYEASDFHSDQSGQIELRFSTPEAESFIETLKKMMTNSQA